MNYRSYDQDDPTRDQELIDKLSQKLQRNPPINVNDVAFKELRTLICNYKKEVYISIMNSFTYR